MSEPTIQELIEEIDLCLELIGYEREALERMREGLDFGAFSNIPPSGVIKTLGEYYCNELIMEDGYEEHLRYGVFPGNLEDG